MRLGRKENNLPKTDDEILQELYPPLSKGSALEITGRLIPLSEDALQRLQEHDTNGSDDEAEELANRYISVVNEITAAVQPLGDIHEIRIGYDDTSINTGARALARKYAETILRLSDIRVYWTEVRKQGGDELVVSLKESNK